MQVILDFYERLIAAAQEQLYCLEQLQAQSRTQVAEWTAHVTAAVRALSQLVVHNHDAKPAYYREVFERNVANRDRLVLREPFTAEHIASMITLIKRKV
jgi:TRAP-type mannitol/chloroaromatic compound transport system substrate-binding protein